MWKKQKYSTKNDKSHDITIFNENQRTKLIIFIINMYIFNWQFQIPPYIGYNIGVEHID